jgi:Right handed beta helix region
MVSGRPRLALRRRRKVMIALGLCAALALSALGIESASASTRSRIALSLNPDRSNAVRLDGATVTGAIYVFVRNSATLDTVDFYLDSRRWTKPPVRTETDPPFDFAGTADDGTAVPYDTTQLADGSHRVTVVLTWSDGTRSSRRGNFTVANSGATAPPTALPTAPTTTAPGPTVAAPTITTTATPTTMPPAIPTPTTQTPTSKPSEPSTAPTSSATPSPATSSSPSATKTPSATPSATSSSLTPSPSVPSTSPTPTPSKPASSLAPSGPVVIDGKSGTVIENVRISSATGECITIRNSQNITIRNSDIGPCGRNAVKVQGSSTIKIVDNYIHSEHKPAGCCDTNDGVFASGTTDLLIQGNTVAFNETNIELSSATKTAVIGNHLLNPLGPFPRGQQVQSWGNGRDVTVEDNYMYSTTDTSQYPFAADQEDAVNFGFTDGITVRNNYIVGGESPSGCGLIADQAANNARFLNNVLVRTGQCGIGLASGTNLVVDGNKIFNNTSVTGGGNTALYVWSLYEQPCGPIQVTNNILYAVKPSGSVNSYWNGGGCGNITYAGNIGGQEAFNLLSPDAQKLPRPATPPKPYSCVAPAPYVTQTAVAPC